MNKNLSEEAQEYCESKMRDLVEEMGEKWFEGSEIDRFEWSSNRIVDCIERDPELLGNPKLRIEIMLGVRSMLDLIIEKFKIKSAPLHKRR